MIVFDLDQVLADDTHRQHILINGDRKDPKVWERYFKQCKKDKPIHWLIDLFNVLQTRSHHQVVIFTGRSLMVEEETWRWLNRWKIYPDWIEFRPEGDKRHDTEVKPEMLKKVIEILGEEVWFIIEDRNIMIKKFRELGYNVLACNDWDY